MHWPSFEAIAMNAERLKKINITDKSRFLDLSKSQCHDYFYDSNDEQFHYAHIIMFFPLPL